MTNDAWRLACAAAVAMALAAGPAAAARADEAAAGPAGAVVLDELARWRWHMTYGPESVRREDGTLEVKRVRAAAYKRGVKSESADIRCEWTAAPPAEWPACDFDDSGWAARAGPLIEGAAGIRAGDIGLPLTPLQMLCLRGTFEVADPQRVTGLSLSLAYRGGAVVYLNGVEVARGHVPAGPVKSDQPAEDYPRACWADDQGRLVPAAVGGRSDLATVFRRMRLDDAGQQSQMRAGIAQRVRRVEKVRVDPAVLRAGANVLAVEFHRPPTSHLAYSGRRLSSYDLYTWPMIGLESLRLSAEPATGADGRGRDGLRVWNASPMRAVLNCDQAGPAERVVAIELFTARNGRWSGQVVVQVAGRGGKLSAVASELARDGGGAAIAAGRVAVRYALADLKPSTRDTRSRPWLTDMYGRRMENIWRFDGLAESPPAQLPANPAGEVAIQPVWVTIAVPAGAAAGTYRGTLSIRLDGAERASVPLVVHVAAFDLPDPQAFVSYVGLVQSPRSVALAYGVGLWSERHWKLLDHAFELLGQAGVGVIYVPVICDTHHGNVDTMVRWVRGGQGAGALDFAIFDRYLDTAVRHLGKEIVVCVYAWDPVRAYGNARQCIPIEVTQLDPATGGTSRLAGPAYEDEGSAAFWQPVFDGIRRRLADRGMAAALAVGVAGQGDPTPAIPVLNRVAPQAGWVSYQHNRPEQFGGKPAAVTGTIYAWPGNMNLLVAGRCYGWRQANPRIAYFPRQGNIHVDDGSRLAMFHMLPETMLVNGFNGFGWLGADFWLVSESDRGSRRSIIRPNWSQLSMGEQSVGYVLGQGPDGPISTARFEMMREGLQEAETRVILERALLDPARRAAMGEELAKRCQDLLDGRITALSRAIGVNTLRSSLPPALKSTEEDMLWYEATHGGRARELYEAAADLAGR